VGCRRCGGRPWWLAIGRRRDREIGCLSASNIRIRNQGWIRTADIRPNTGDSGPADRRIHTPNEVCTGTCAISNDRALAGRRPVAVRDWDRPYVGVYCCYVPFPRSERWSVSGLELECGSAGRNATSRRATLRGDRQVYTPMYATLTLCTRPNPDFGECTIDAAR